MLADRQRSPSDLSRVNLSEEWEIRWWCDHFGCTEIALRNAVNNVGDSAGNVERKLKEAQKEVFKNMGED